MIGRDLKAWRKRNGYSAQADLQNELGVKSRGTISAWEASEEPIPRMLELALLALEKLPAERRIDGKRLTPSERRAFRAREAARSGE